MKQKLIVTLWKAQLQLPPECQAGKGSVYCRLTYNGQEHSSKPTTTSKNMTWKQTFVLELAAQSQNLKLQFIALNEGELVHYAKDQIAESLCFGHATHQVTNLQKGSIPCKLVVHSTQPIGKVFIEYETIRAEVEYSVHRKLDYQYLLKINNFRLCFVRPIKPNTYLYLLLAMQNRQQREEFPFQVQEDGSYVYNYPVKLFIKDEQSMIIEINVKEYSQKQFKGPNGSTVSASITSKRTDKSKKNFLQLGKEVIQATMELKFTKDTSVKLKLPIRMGGKQKMEIGSVEIDAEVFFKSQRDLMEVRQEQRKLLNPQHLLRGEQNKFKQQNGKIVINSLIGRLEPFNQQLINNKNISMRVKLGKQQQQSTVLENPGKELIFIDSFAFHRVWEQTLKLIIQVHNAAHQRIPTFFADINLRDLFESGRLFNKKASIFDYKNNNSGEVMLDVVFTPTEVKRKQIPTRLQQPSLQKKEQIQLRMKAKEEEKMRQKEVLEQSTITVLRENGIILPPLRKRIQTLSSPTKHLNIYNTEGVVRFSKSPRFKEKQRESPESFLFVRESDFDLAAKRNNLLKNSQVLPKRKVSSVLSNMFDSVVDNPGVGRYQIPSVWDKYK